MPFRRLRYGCRSYRRWAIGSIFISIIVYSIYFRPQVDSNFLPFQTSESSRTRFLTAIKNEPHLANRKIEKNERRKEKTNGQAYSCQIPQIDPFDPSILSYVEHPRQANCSRVQPDLVSLDKEGTLKVNMTAMREVEKNGNVTCWYKYFDRGSTDKKIIYGKKKKLLEKPVKMKKPFVKVACYQGFNSTRIFINILANPAAPVDHPRPRSVSKDDTRISVYIMALESASSSMVYRHLPKTLDHLNRTGAIIFKKFLKTGENTLPNMAAVFTGKRDRKEQENMPAELPKPKGGFYDNWPMIWKNFTKKGYETVFMEDAPHLSTFHFSGKGFKKKPVDRWYFPFWFVQRQRYELTKKSSEFCFGNKPKYEIFTDIIRGELTRANTQNRPQFMYTLFNDLSHDYTSDLERADDTWFQLFHQLDSKGVLNRTILIVMGDHGPRFSTHRQTLVGFAEERLPFLAIRVPQFLYSRYPRLRNMLEINADSRLVSMFDLHETLVDILDQSFDGESSHDTSIRGRSLFTEIPSDRTCLQAGVPDRYCLCGGFQVIPNYHVTAMLAAEVVLAEVAKMVIKYQDKCATWKLYKILYFLRVPWPEEVAGVTDTYIVAFKTKPFNAKFEGVVVRNMTDGSVKFKQGSLERISAFGNLGDCVMKLQKFCACKEYL